MNKHQLDQFDNFHEDYQPPKEHLLAMLDGDVNSQGIKLSHREWLDMGSEQWSIVSDEDKAKAYQAATKIGGWDDKSIKIMMMKSYSHLREATMNMTLEILHDLAEKYPIPVEVLDNKVDERVKTDLEIKVKQRQ